jgi:hypothetical protein
VPGEAALVPELHGQADDVVAFGAQHRRDGGGVHTARHGYGNRVCIQLIPQGLKALVMFPFYAALKGCSSTVRKCCCCWLRPSKIMLRLEPSTGQLMPAAKC